MILYFTGTGNSFFVAKMLSKKTGDSLVSLNEIFKSGQKWEFRSETPFVLVAPIYAWRLPQKVEELIEKASFIGNRKLYVIATMASYAGDAEKYCRKIAYNRHMEFMGFESIPMPNNYFPSSAMPSKQEAVAQIRSSLPLVCAVGERIVKQAALSQKKNKAWDAILSGIVNWGFQNFEKNSRYFCVSSACVQCKQCVTGCPTNNITLTGGKIHFGEDCMFCLSCIHKCPVHAIDYKGKLAKNGYYICPDDSEILNG